MWHHTDDFDKSGAERCKLDAVASEALQNCSRGCALILPQLAHDRDMLASAIPDALCGGGGETLRGATPM